MIVFNKLTGELFMRSYERTKRGHSFSVTSKGKEETKACTFNLPLHVINYLNYYATCKGVDMAHIVRSAIIQCFQENDLKIFAENGYKDYDTDDYKSPEYIQLFEMSKGK